MARYVSLVHVSLRGPSRFRPLTSNVSPLIGNISCHKREKHTLRPFRVCGVSSNGSTIPVPNQPKEVMNSRTVLVATLVVTGCATPTWRHSTKGTQEFYQDNSQCMAMAGSGQANQVVGANDSFTRGYNQGLALRAQSNQQAIHEQCMYGNGWYLSR